jgi:hypothetical protein
MDNKKAEASRRAKRNRTAGHTYERKLAEDYREAGFTDALTARNESRTLDNCQVDIARIPFFPQAKYGYKSMSVSNYVKILTEMEELLKKHGITDDYPLLIHHRRSTKKMEDLVIIPRKHFFKLIKQISI